MKIERVLLMPNLDKENGLECANAVAGKLMQLGLVPLLDERFRPYLSQSGAKLGPFYSQLASCDLILPVGGDGTILHSVQHAVEADKPLLGVNTGRVGFLTQLEASELDVLKKLVCGGFAVEERILIEAVFPGKNGEMECRFALNDLVFAHEQSKLVDLMVFDREKQIAHHRANGLIFATPTGSTAYNLSAGGSIADPTLSLMLLTAICPYSAYNRSFILPADREYTVNMEKGNLLHLSVDGERVGAVTGNQTIRVRKSSHTVRFLDMGLRDFYSNLTDKLSLRR